ncbi:MAG: hypothetical protein ACKPKO_51635, partial [Candidatus Fonsibacter sp.]
MGLDQVWVVPFVSSIEGARAQQVNQAGHGHVPVFVRECEARVRDLVPHRGQRQAPIAHGDVQYGAELLVMAHFVPTCVGEGVAAGEFLGVVCPANGDNVRWCAFLVLHRAINIVG